MNETSWLTSYGHSNGFDAARGRSLYLEVSCGDMMQTADICLGFSVEYFA